MASTKIPTLCIIDLLPSSMRMPSAPSLPLCPLTWDLPPGCSDKAWQNSPKDTMSVTAQTNGNLTLTDSLASTTQLSKVISGSFTGTESSIGQSVLIGTSPTTLALPVNPIHKLYLKNLSGANTVTVTWTPTGGASVVVLTLQPGDYIDLVSSGASGISALSVTASVASTPIEFWLLG